MPPHPKFSGKYIMEEQHEECVLRFGVLYKRFIEPILDNLGLYPRGRWHKKDAPCLYVFRHKRMYEEDKRSLFLHFQETRTRNAIEVVFHKKGEFSPLDERKWRTLEPCYFEPNKDNWKSFVVRNNNDIAKVRHLIQLAIVAYDQHEW